MKMKTFSDNIYFWKDCLKRENLFYQSYNFNIFEGGVSNIKKSRMKYETFWIKRSFHNDLVQTNSKVWYDCNIFFKRSQVFYWEVNKFEWVNNFLLTVWKISDIIILLVSFLWIISRIIFVAKLFFFFGKPFYDIS